MGELFATVPNMLQMFLLVPYISLSICVRCDKVERINSFALQIHYFHVSVVLHEENRLFDGTWKKDRRRRRRTHFIWHIFIHFYSTVTSFCCWCCHTTCPAISFSQNGKNWCASRGYLVIYLFLLQSSLVFFSSFFLFPVPSEDIRWGLFIIIIMCGQTHLFVNSSSASNIVFDVPFERLSCVQYIFRSALTMKIDSDEHSALCKKHWIRRDK